jgi:hypothetical protein
MQLKGETKITTIFTICIMLISIGLSGCVEEDGEKGKNEFEYIVNINSNSNFILRVPLVIELDYQNVSEIMSNLKIIGDGEYKIEYSIYGPCLNISGKNNLIIESKGNTFVNFGILSLKNDSDSDGILKDEGPNVEYWYYFNSNDNFSISFDIQCRIKHENGTYYSELYITNISKKGWNKTKGKESIILQ